MAIINRSAIRELSNEFPPEEIAAGKHKSGKIDMSYLPSDVFHIVYDVFKYGETVKGYEKNSWKNIDVEEIAYSLKRHVDEIHSAVVRQGKDGIAIKDHESGIEAVGHAMCNCAMLIERMKTKG